MHSASCAFGVFIERLFVIIDPFTFNTCCVRLLFSPFTSFFSQNKPAVCDTSTPEVWEQSSTGYLQVNSVELICELSQLNVIKWALLPEVDLK